MSIICAMTTKYLKNALKVFVELLSLKYHLTGSIIMISP